jgi:hypothetical protein
MLDENSARWFVLLNKQNGLGETGPGAYFHPRVAHALQSPNPSHIDKITSATISFGFGEGVT